MGDAQHGDCSPSLMFGSFQALLYPLHLSPSYLCQAAMDFVLGIHNELSFVRGVLAKGIPIEHNSCHLWPFHLYQTPLPLCHSGINVCQQCLPTMSANNVVCRQQCLPLCHGGINVFHQEYIIDKSMKPRIPTVNDILRNWRRETSHVGKFTKVGGYSDGMHKHCYMHLHPAYSCPYQAIMATYCDT